ncbi:conserved exported hypothetical protein [Vibrio nigripulchritudo FTn2]|uniref:hypothetical protein n=1 Tax=Vibrio nigripulchritudo TaxID=28173 RepID=UPI0003B1B5BF|nr:hypothetical protein [Vibrio nigripulchritudo]CCN39728.1 conserved exported hypothetical protein [Vibrio nigripulchritudo FTn2]
MKVKGMLSILALVSGCMSGFAHSAPLLQEVDTLQVSVRTVWAPEAQTVEDAVEWIIEPLGYSILTEYPAPDAAKMLLNQPIPTAAKLHRTMPALHAIQLLIGIDNTIIVDKKHRLMTFARGK